MRDVGEELVAEVMPEAVVHELEVIDVEVHHGEADAVAARVREAVHEPVAEEQPVRQRRERVVIRAILELLLRLLPLRDVAIVDDDRADARLLQQVLSESFQPHPRAVLVAEAQLAVRFFVRRRENFVEHLPRDSHVARMNELEDAAADQLVLVVADQVMRRRAGEGEVRVRVEQHHAAPALLDDRAESFLALLERALRAGARDGLAGDVRAGAEERQFVVGERALVVAVGEEHAERTVLRADDHARAAAHAVVVAKMRALEARLFFEVRERERTVGEERDHADRLVFVFIAAAMEERRVRAEGGAEDHASARCDLQRAGMTDAQRELDERADLAEENERVDAGERGLPELRHRRFLAIARVELRAEARQFVIRSIARADEVKRLRDF